MEKTEISNFDWAKAFFAHEESKKATSPTARRDSSADEVADDFRRYKAIEKMLAMKDGFTPAAVNQFNTAELPFLWELSDQFAALSQSLPVYDRYKQIVDKLLVLIYTSMPDEIETLSAQRKDDLFGMKMTLPTEKSLYRAVYAYTLRHQPDDLQGTGVSFEDAVEIRQNPAAKKSPAFLDKVLQANNEYKRYFLEKKNAEDSRAEARI